MANLCDFELHARGKGESLDRLARIFRGDDKQYKMHRVYTNDVYVEYAEDTVRIKGSCAWSALGCMSKTNMFPVMESDPSFTCLEDLSKELDLEIELFAEELGMCLEEYAWFYKGITCALSSWDIKSLYYYQSDIDAIKLDENGRDWVSEDFYRFVEAGAICDGEPIPKDAVPEDWCCQTLLCGAVPWNFRF